MIRARPREYAHPAFAPFARWHARCPGGGLPDLAALNAWARETALALPDGRPLAFVAPPRRTLPGLAFEHRIAERAEIVTRADNLHDTCNALAWLLLPWTKAALNAIHVRAANAAPPGARGGARGRARDAATLLDESGLLVACADAALVDLWRAHAWREAFLEGRLRVARALRVVVIGHGVLAKCAAPFRAITARALVLPLVAAELPSDAAVLAAALDRAAAAHLAAMSMALAPGHLLPLPIAVLPGWDTENLGAQLYDDVSVFRPRSRFVRGEGFGVLR